MSTRVIKYSPASSSGYLSAALWDGFSPESVLSYARPGFWLPFNFCSLGNLTTDGLEGWVTTLVEAGASESTITFPDGHGGSMLVTTDAADYDGVNMQHGQAEWVNPASCDFLAMEARFKLSDADQMSTFLGYTTTDTTILASSSAHAVSTATRFGVYSIDSSAALKYTHDDNTTDKDGTLATMVDDTYIKVGMVPRKSTKDTRWYVNGELVQAVEATAINDDFRPSMAWRTGETTGNTCTLDWIVFGGYFA